MTAYIRALVGFVAVAALVGCSLPRGAALRSEVVGTADDANADFAIYDVSRALLPTIAQWPLVGEENLSWISASTGLSSQIVQPGDIVTMVIWDSNENSLLTPVGARQVTLENVRVSPSGSVFVPYVGDVSISGLSPESARERVQAELAPIAPSAQVQLTMVEGRANSVDLVGGVAAPGNYPMPHRNYTVLNLVADGGGVAADLRNPQIRLVRGSQIFGTSIDRLYEQPQLDTLLKAGDQVIVEEDERYFLSVGAAGTEALQPFPQDVVTAMDAVSIIGGVNDNRANIQSVLIMREYPRSALSAGVQGPRKERVIFTLDLSSADGLFSARRFRIAPKDVVYVAESPLPVTEAVLAVAASTFGLATRLRRN